MIDKEKVRELVTSMCGANYTEFEYNRATEWLEQNQPSPVVVGLSDEQAGNLATFLTSPDHKDMDVDTIQLILDIKEWAKTQTFAQLQNKEIPVGLSYEQIRNLFNYVECKETRDFFTQKVVDWQKSQTFARPEVKEIPVGLTDEQIISLGNFHESTGDTFFEIVKEWQKTQAFARPPDAGVDVVAYDKRINELVAELKHLKKEHDLLEDTHAHLKVAYDELKSQQSEVKEVPVGLSDWQVKNLTKNMGLVTADKIIKNWLKTQNFADYNNEGKVYELDGSVTDYKSDYERVSDNFIELEEEYSELKKELEKLKSQLRPNWNDAPDKATSYEVCLKFFDNRDLKISDKRIYGEQRPQPPAPVVEDVQVWRYVGENKQYDKSDYEISLLGKIKVNDRWEQSVTYKRVENQEFYTRTLSDFLAKFERVS